MLPDLDLAVLREVAQARSQLRQVPKAHTIAERLGLRSHMLVLGTLRDLEDAGLVTGAPPVGGYTTTYVSLTVEGWHEALCNRATVLPLLPAPGRATAGVASGRAIEPRWRCVDCGAVTFNSRKSCVICPLLAVEPIEEMFVAIQGAA